MQICPDLMKMLMLYLQHRYEFLILEAWSIFGLKVDINNEFENYISLFSFFLSVDFEGWLFYQLILQFLHASGG